MPRPSPPPTSSSPSLQCFFSQCPLPATNVGGVYKCASHRYRAKCRVEGCPNQAYARNMCVRHGGKATCKAEHCQSKCRVGEFCIRHGPTAARARCSAVDCDKTAQPSSGKCAHHGGGRFCKVDGCFSKGQFDGVCSFHHTLQQTKDDDENDIGATIEPLQWSEALLPEEEEALLAFLLDATNPLQKMLGAPFEEDDERQGPVVVVPAFDNLAIHGLGFDWLNPLSFNA
ncbi:Aste57867_8463 [Aphanomyces stellatus]|uniref:Aste57867_8463 protein n=1 Tax=Aphanomyces stellatus TaxID=120398 RepID=A0A485KKB8_9STRA|nr:hypothetical protein As57867_008431 [Aphanomyces stellatus]VFT85349.1 Aste57867_8463 [Aphanomyces stellatus]